MTVNDRFRTLTATAGAVLIGSGLADAFANAFAYAEPATFFLAGGPLLTAAILRRGSR